MKATILLLWIYVFYDCADKKVSVSNRKLQTIGKQVRVIPKGKRVLVRTIQEFELNEFVLRTGEDCD